MKWLTYFDKQQKCTKIMKASRNGTLLLYTNYLRRLLMLILKSILLKPREFEWLAFVVIHQDSHCPNIVCYFIENFLVFVICLLLQLLRQSQRLQYLCAICVVF